MRINHFNSLLDGGAATAALRLHAGLLNSGVESHFYYAKSQGRRPGLDDSHSVARWSGQGFASAALSYYRFRQARQRLKRLTRRRPPGHEVFTSPHGAPHTARESDLSRREIIHLHWVAKFLDYQSFFRSLAPGQPVVWTLHDMNAFTGGCHFSDGCDRYQRGCGACPQLSTAGRGPDSPASATKPTSLPVLSTEDSRGYSSGDLSHEFFQAKLAALTDIDLHIVAPSRWLLGAAKSSPILAGAGSFNHIPYGISTDDYYPMDRLEARARLGIDPDVTLVCFGAMDVKSRRKGSRELLRAISQVADLPSVEGLVFGKGSLPDSDYPRPKMHHVGAVHGLLTQRAVYSAADVFVLPSLEDNLPLTGLEAMACGTPIVGFDVGGIPDYVHPGQTGLLARAADADDLGEKLRAIVTDPARASIMGQRSRRRIEAEFGATREASAYKALYAALSETDSATRAKAA